MFSADPEFELFTALHHLVVSQILTIWRFWEKRRKKDNSEPKIFEHRKMFLIIHFKKLDIILWDLVLQKPNILGAY